MSCDICQNISYTKVGGYSDGPEQSDLLIVRQFVCDCNFDAYGRNSRSVMVVFALYLKVGDASFLVLL